LYIIKDCGSNLHVLNPPKTFTLVSFQKEKVYNMKEHGREILETISSSKSKIEVNTIEL